VNLSPTRQRAVDLIRAYVPSDTGSAQFAEITGGDYGGVGTTCGYLPSWLFHKMGCYDGRIINRTDLAHGLRYTIGANIDRLATGAKALGASRSIATGPPLPGDGVFYTNGPSSTEHVALVLDATSPDVWQTADAGIRNDRGYQCARQVSRRIDPKTGRVFFSDGPRSVAAIFDLEKIVPPVADDDGPMWLAGIGLLALVWRLLHRGIA